MENMKKFIEKVRSDNTLMAKIHALGRPDKCADGFAALAAEYGFIITKDEYETFVRQKTGQLGEEDLDEVVGGNTVSEWTSNNYDPKECGKISKASPRCWGLVFFLYCDHYRAITLKNSTGHSPPYIHYKCVMGRYDYERYGSEMG